jgi:hypothetical protein
MANNLYNSSKFYNATVDSNKHIFDNPYLIIIILLIALCFFGYAVYYYMTNNPKNIKQSSSYYGKDMAFFTPVFNNTTNTIDDCISQCTNDLTCDGITYNYDTSYCTGTRNGVIRADSNNLSSWVKPQQTSKTATTAKLASAILVGNTRGSKIIDSVKFSQLYELGKYSYSFTLTIFDFYKNFGTWRHIFHKGTELKEDTILNYQSWETLTMEIPDQTIGVWISPFTNNMRIAMTTSSVEGLQKNSWPDAFVQKCNETTGACFITDLPSGKWTDTSKLTDGSVANTRVRRYIEYFDHDLQSIPINTKVNITINIMNQNIEVYMNGKLTKNSTVNGMPLFNKSRMFVMHENTINGELKNLLYFPTSLRLTDIKNIMALDTSK